MGQRVWGERERERENLTLLLRILNESILAAEWSSSTKWMDADRQRISQACLILSNFTYCLRTFSGLNKAFKKLSSNAACFLSGSKREREGGGWGVGVEVAATLMVANITSSTEQLGVLGRDPIWANGFPLGSCLNMLLPRTETERRAKKTSGKVPF